MTFLDLAKRRFTCRKFMPLPLPIDKLMYILESGRVAPTVGNLQSVRLFVIDQPDLLRKLKLRVQLHDAPVAILVGSDPQVAYKDQALSVDASVADATVCTTHMTLAATDIGLASLWISKFDPEWVKSQYELPEGIRLIHILALGIPDQTKDPDRHTLERLPLSRMVTTLKKSD
jgi:nitroreductase